MKDTMRTIVRRLIVTTWIVGIAVTAMAAAEPEDRVETVDMRSITGRVLSVTPEKVEIVSGGKTLSIRRADVTKIVLSRADDLMIRKGQTVVATIGGGLLAAGNLKIVDNNLVFDSPLLGKAKLPVTAASMLYIPTKRRYPLEIRKKIADKQPSETTRDVLFMVSGDSWMTVRGIIEGLDAENVTFNWKGERRLIARKDVSAIRLADIGEKPPAPAGTILSVRGSRIAFTALSLKGDKFIVESSSLGKWKAPRKAVAAVLFHSDRVVNLSDIKPNAVKEYGFFGTAFPYRVNLSVGGSKLRIGGKSYATGLGMHSFCELSWDIGGKYGRFVAVIGIDDAVRPAGDASVTFLGDGKVLAGPFRVTGKSEPKVIRFDLSRVRSFTIRVQFGDDKLDVSDHVDIAGARLIKIP